MLMRGFWQDFRYAVRMLSKNRGITVVAILTLALGIGANTAIFSVVNAVLLRPLPYKNAEELVKVWGKLANEGIPQNWISEPEWWELKETNDAFSEVAAYSLGGGGNLTSADHDPVRVTAASATASLFPLLGTQPFLGRTFAPDEDQLGKNQVALVSYRLWKSQFGADAHLPGQTIHLDGKPYTVAGVLPDGFSFGRNSDVWTPLGLNREKPQDRGSHYLHVIARRKPGVSFEQANTEMDRFAKRLAHEYPDAYVRGADPGWGVYTVPLKEEVVGKVRQALLILFAAVVFVLLIACANIANLQLARASVREKEVSIRAALGAGVWRISRQLLTENILLSLVGGGAGLFLAVWGVAALRALSPANLRNVEGIRIDGTVFLFTLGISLLTGLFFGLAPVVHIVRARLAEKLKASGRGTAGTRSHRLRGALVVSEVALALVLLVGAGLMIRSFQRLLEVDPGFRSDHLLTLQIALPTERYKDDVHVAYFYRQLMERLRTLPGVKAAGAVSELPLSGNYSSGTVFVENTTVADVPRFAGAAYIETDRRAATAGYFEAMQMRLVRGRLFTDADEAATQFVAIVDSDFAGRFWPGKDAIGQRIAIDAIPGSKPAQPRWRTIVGVVKHIKHYALDVPGREQAYFPHSQAREYQQMALAIRGAGDPLALTGAVREKVQSLDREVPLYDVNTMEELLSASVAQSRLNLILLAVFASVALLLAAVGIYGVMSYSVTQRVHEIGIRMSLGAETRDVLRLILAEGMLLAGMGVGVGLAGAFVLTRFISNFFFGVRPNDPVTFAGITALLSLVALAACFIPARRATQVNPIIALRYE
jgi:predicted permease